MCFFIFRGFLIPQNFNGHWTPKFHPVTTPRVNPAIVKLPFFNKPEKGVKNP